MNRKNLLITLIVIVFAFITGCKKDDPVKPTPTPEPPAPQEDTVFVEKVVLNESAISLLVGENQKLTYQILPDSAYYKTITWSSNDEKVATVDSLGVVTAVKAGETEIQIAVDTVKASCKVFVNEEIIEIEEVILNETEIELVEGDSFQLTYTIKPENANYETVTWTSGDETVATVDSLGMVKAVAAGATEIELAVDTIIVSCKVIVNELVIPVEEIILSQTSLVLFEGDTVRLTFEVVPENANYETVKWSSTDETKATVDQDGLVTAIAAGAAGIKLEVDDAEEICIVLVKKPVPHVEKVILNENSIELTEDDTFQLAFTIEPEDAEYETVTWTSSNPAIATVDENGLVTAVSEGNADIIVAVDNVEAGCNVKVNAKPQGFALDIQINNITPNNAEFTIIPNDDTKTYYVYGMFKSKYDVESTYSELGIFGFDQSWYQMVGGSNWVTVMLSDCKSGVYSGKATDYKNFITYDTEFVIYAYGFDEGGAPTTEVFKQVFSTLPMNPSNNNINVTINQVFTNGVNATFHTTNSTQYYVTLQKKSYVSWWQENGGLIEMALDVLAAETYIQLLSGDTTIQPDSYYYCNSANTDYYIVYFSYDEENGIRSDIHLEPFHTAAN